MAVAPQIDQLPALTSEEGLAAVLVSVERELRALVWRADRLQEAMGDLIQKAGDRLGPESIEEAQGIDYISQRLIRLARVVGEAAFAAGAHPYTDADRHSTPPARASGDLELF
ncbi:MAG TPA: hypothetical protein VJP88_05650 [Caulobacteraceae bacterium]|nr:hypothetical protein [Caulobacteraceae bacterium]